MSYFPLPTLTYINSYLYWFVYFSKNVGITCKYKRKHEEFKKIEHVFLLFLGDSIYNDVGFISAKDRDPAQWVPKINKTNSPRKIVPNKKDNLLDGILFGKGKSDCDLITLITDQMFSAEKELQITRTHLMDTMSKLNERDLEILKLHEKVSTVFFFLIF